MTSKEFLQGTPFIIDGIEGIHKYDSEQGGELLLYVNGEWHYSIAVSAYGRDNFTLAAVIRDGVVKHEYRIRYDECIRVQL